MGLPPPGLGGAMAMTVRGLGGEEVKEKVGLRLSEKKCRELLWLEEEKLRGEELKERKEEENFPPTGFERQRDERKEEETMVIENIVQKD